jgi:hypothetical protein
MISFPCLYMDLSGRLHALAVSVLGERDPVPTEQEIRGIPEPICTLCRKQLLSLPIIEPRFVGCPARSLVTIRTAMYGE